MLNPWRDLRGLPASMWALALATLINRLGAMFLPFLVLYLTSEKDATLERAGNVVTMFGVGALLMAPLGGRLIDRVGAKQMLMLSLVASGVLLCVFPFVPGYVGAVGMTLVIAIAMEPGRSSTMTLVTGLVAPEQRKPAYALSRLASNLGTSVGPVVGAAILKRSFAALFLVDGITSLLAAVVIAFLLPSSASAAATAPAPDANGPSSAVPLVTHVGPAWRDRSLLAALLVTLAVGTLFFQLESSMPLYITGNLGLSIGAYSRVFTVNTLMIVLLEVQLAGATALWPHTRALSLGCVLIAMGFGAMAFVHGEPTLLGVTAIWTFGEMIYFPAMITHVSDLSPPHRRGEYMGLYMMAYGLSLTIGPTVGTTVLQRAGGRALWAGAFGLGLVAALASTRLPTSKVVSSSRGK